MPEQRITITEAMDAINTLRSEVIATQNAGWSTTIYPLVAILNAAGYEQFDPTEKQIDEYLDCHGGAGGYPGNPKREAPSSNWKNPVSKMQHMAKVIRNYLEEPTEHNLTVLHAVLEGIERG
jgi:hypothetical protein